MIGETWSLADRAQPLEHEGQQVGYAVECPNCGSAIPVPIAEFIDLGTWSVPPQNAEFAARGWHFGWGTESDPAKLHLRQSSAVPRSDHVAGADDRIVCSRRSWTATGDIENAGCGRAYTVVGGQLTEVE